MPVRRSVRSWDETLDADAEAGGVYPALAERGGGESLAGLFDDEHGVVVIVAELS
jgi:hypothetical protein